MIEGLVVQELKKIEDERGSVMHMLRVDSELYKKFGEIYFSSIKPGVIKAWKRHSQMTQLFAVPVGSISLVIYDSRENSGTCGKLTELAIGGNKYCLVKIPPRVWYGFKCTSSGEALIANCTDIPHCANEVERVNIADLEIPYKWK